LNQFVSLPQRPPPGVREPAQARSRERVQRILAAAERLAEAHPLPDISIAMISDVSGIKRSTIYQFFPTVAAILNTLGQRFLDELYEDHVALAAQLTVGDWTTACERSVDTTVAFYSRHPAACSLFLGDGSLHGLRIIDQDFDRRHVELLRALLGGGRSIQPTEAGDPIQLIITTSISVLALSVHLHGRITDYYQSQAKVIAKAYLAPYMASSTRESGRRRRPKS
jgi:AcrR family transcriptional regulator